MRNQALSGNVSALAPTAGRILDAARTIVAEHGYAGLTMAEVERVSGANRALVSYYFGSKVGLLAALVDSLFQDPDGDPVEKIRDSLEGSDRTRRFLQWQEKVSANDRVNRVLHEMLPVAMRDPMVRKQFADAYRLYRTIDAECLSSAPAKLTGRQADSLAAVAIAVVEGLAIQRALDPDFDHEYAWQLWTEVIGQYLQLSGPGIAPPNGRTETSRSSHKPRPGTVAQAPRKKQPKEISAR